MRSTSRARVGSLTVLLAIVLPAGGLDAGGTRSFELVTLKDFEKAKLEGAKVSSQGEVSLGYPARLVSGLDKEVWAARVGADGKVYVATGNSSALYRVEGDKLVKVYSADEVAFTTIARAADGRLLLGAISSGRIYAVDVSGPKEAKGEVLATVPAPFIWAMVVDRAGTIYVGTGPEGVIYRIGADREPRVHYDTRDGNVLALVEGPSGELWAGTALRGLLYRIPRADEGRVEADFTGHEVRSLCFGGSTLYIGLNQGHSRAETTLAPGPSRLGAEFARLAKSLTRRFDGTELGREGDTELASPVALARPEGPSAARVEALTPDGRLETVFRTDQGPIMDVEVDADGLVLVATGREGRVYAVRPHDVHYLLFALEEAQAVTLALEGGRLAVVGCANPGAVALVAREPGRTGRITCPPLDAQVMASWGEARWDGSGSVTLSTRSGNTRSPDHTWSAWVPAVGRDRLRVGAPAGRYLQARIEIDRDPAATLHGLRLFYLTANQRPVIESVEVRSSDVAAPVREPDRTSATAGVPPDLRKMLANVPGLAGVTLGQEARAAPSPERPSTEEKETAPRPEPQAERPHSPVKTIRWVATDRDQDTLVHRLHFRAKGEDLWVPITPREPITGSSHSWNTEPVPDGRYVVKVVSSDERSTPAAGSLTAERVSAVFTVDNGRPHVEARLDPGTRRLVGVARDEVSPIARIEVCVDGQEWLPVAPRDRILDSRVEEFTVSLPDVAPGAHAIAVRATDSEANVGSVRLIVRMTGP